MKEGVQMPNTELPIDLENQVVLIRNMWISGKEKRWEIFLDMQAILERVVMENIF